VLAGVLLGRSGGAGDGPAAPAPQAAASAVAAPPAAPLPAPSPARTVPAADPAAAGAAVPTSTPVVLSPAAARGEGDLGLATPVTRPACDGQFITIVGSAVQPGSYPADVARLLSRHPGSAYLFAGASCSSLRARLPNGNSIYAVFVGPFPTQAQACATRRTIGGDSYVRVLDDVTPNDRLVKC
jgi:serine/threonine-protein kinase